MKKKVMVLAGTKSQIPIINKLHENNCEVYNVNLYEDSPAFAYADYSAVMDILDKEKCLQYAQENNIDAVLSDMCDIATPTIAYVSDKIGAPSIGLEMAELYTNKFAMREFGMKHDIPTPEYKICRCKQEAIDFFNTLNRKIIIKPLDSNSSRGVFTINSVDDLNHYFDVSLSYSHIEKAVICERYINGTEFTVDGLVTEYGHISLAISQKHHYKHNENIADELFFSHHNNNFNYDLLRKTNDRFVDLSGLKFGLTHAEYKYEDGKYYLIEIGARGGGNFISSTIVPLMSGVDNYDYLINKVFGRSMKDKISVEKKYWDRCCVLKFFDTPDNGGTVTDIQGLDFLNKSKNVIEYSLDFEIGDTIEPAKNDSARIGYYIAVATSEKELRKVMNKIESKLIICVG